MMYITGDRRDRKIIEGCSCCSYRLSSLDETTVFPLFFAVFGLFADAPIDKNGGLMTQKALGNGQKRPFFLVGSEFSLY
jgi:hypothetical protein